MAYTNDQDDELVIFDAVDDAVVTDSYSMKRRLVVTFKLHNTLRSWVITEAADSSGNSCPDGVIKLSKCTLSWFGDFD